MTSPPTTWATRLQARLGLTRESFGMATIAQLAPLLALVLLVIIGAVVSPSFLSAGNIRSILLTSVILMIFALGQTFVISTGGIDLSVSSIAQLSGVFLGMIVSWGFAPELGIVGAILVGAAAGALNGFIVSKLKITDFIVTLGTFSAYSGLTLLLSDARPQIVSSRTLTVLSTGGFGILSYMLILALAVATIAYIVMFHTPFGTHLLAVGGNRKAADALGVSFTRVKVGVYAISGGLAAVAGILLVARLGAAEPTAGSAYQLTSIAAAVLGGVSLFGGKASIIGPLLGALVLTGVVNLLTITGVPVYYQPIAVGAVVILAAYLRRYER
jgi:ribose/xylose/arabinose/galactoside ABC-type transport system permease subunit